MKKILIEGARRKMGIAFKTSFNELDTDTFCDFLVKEEKLSSLESRAIELDKELAEVPEDAPNVTDLVIIVDAEIQDTIRKIRALKIELLALLSNNYKKTISFLINTRGVKSKYVDAVLLHLHDSFGDFDEWVKRVPCIKQFKFTDYKREAFWNFKTKIFEVFNTESQTVLRDAAASLVARKIDAYSAEFSANRWANLPKFLAYACRPSFEKEEIAADKKKAKGSFFGGAQVAAMSVDDRLSAYNSLLAETAEKRAVIFKKLPLVTAIGAYKQYFFLSQN